MASFSDKLRAHRNPIHRSLCSSRPGGICCTKHLVMETKSMAVSKKISSKNSGSDSPLSTVSEKPAAAATTPGPAKKKAASQKTTASKKKTVARKQAPPAAKKKATSKKAAASPARPAPSSANRTKPLISQQQRQQMIGDAAYLISVKRAPWQGDPDSDWMAAETVIDMIFDVVD